MKLLVRNEVDPKAMISLALTYQSNKKRSEFRCESRCEESEEVDNHCSYKDNFCYDYDCDYDNGNRKEEAEQIPYRKITKNNKRRTQTIYEVFENDVHKYCKECIIISEDSDDCKKCHERDANNKPIFDGRRISKKGRRTGDDDSSEKRDSRRRRKDSCSSDSDHHGRGKRSRRCDGSPDRSTRKSGSSPSRNRLLRIKPCGSCRNRFWGPEEREYDGSFDPIDPRTTENSHHGTGSWFGGKNPFKDIIRAGLLCSYGYHERENEPSQNNIAILAEAESKSRDYGSPDFLKYCITTCLLGSAPENPNARKEFKKAQFFDDGWFANGIIDEKLGLFFSKHGIFGQLLNKFAIRPEYILTRHYDNKDMNNMRDFYSKLFEWPIEDPEAIITEESGLDVISESEGEDESTASSSTTESKKTDKKGLFSGGTGKVVIVVGAVAVLGTVGAVIWFLF